MKNRLNGSTCLSRLLLATGCQVGTWAVAASPPPPPPEDSAAPTRQSAAAATATAEHNPLCSVARLGPYYWEIGSLPVPSVSGSTGPGANTVMSVASGSKWLYAAYVLEHRSLPGGLDEVTDLPFLHFTSGYTQLGNVASGLFCGVSAVSTVDDCLNVLPASGQQDPSTTGKFDYDSGHMQKHASLHGMGSMDAASLTAEISQSLGVSFNYAQPLVPAGIRISAAQYRAFLRKIMSGQLNMANYLGAYAVCTNPTDLAHGCSPDQSLPAPIPATESWHYALGHWIEDDPVVGDGAYSSPGALGFYAWIDASRQYYGILARQRDGDEQGFASGYESAECGRLIRRAWLTGREQTGEQPQ